VSVLDSRLQPRGWCVPAQWSRLASVGAEVCLGARLQFSSTSRGSRVQALRPTPALMPWEIVPLESLQLKFRSHSSSRGFYPKRYSLLSESIDSRANAKRDGGQPVGFTPTISLQLFWHADCWRDSNWPPASGSTTRIHIRSRVGFGSQQILSPALALRRFPGDAR
jgi:hypothetical protein